MSQEQQKIMGKLVSKVWSDDALKQRLIANPTEVLREQGLNVPPGVKIEVHEDSDAVRHIVIPKRPGQLSDEQLDLVAGGGDPAPLTITAVIPT
jgi:hypothetical protein